MTIFTINTTAFQVSPPPIHYHISSHNSGKHISINMKFIIFKHIGCGRGTSNASDHSEIWWSGKSSLGNDVSVGRGRTGANLAKTYEAGETEKARDGKRLPCSRICMDLRG